MFPACINLTSGIIYTGNSRCLCSMTVLKTESPALAGMNDKLWLEKTCSILIPDLPLWIIEYAWSKRMMEVLEVLGPPLWLEGDWCLLTLEEPCRIRVVAAEVWRIVQARDIKHFERVTQFLDVTYQLVPRLVTPIKHMKIMFGLQTLVIMWMLWNDQSAAKIIEKMKRLFPNHLSQYYKCSRRHMVLMQKNIDDFKSFTLVLARNRNMRETYIRDLIEEQYGECYAQKLEERLSQYLEELDKALPQPTHIEQVLKQSLPQGTGEKILKKLLSRGSASLASVLRRLLNSAVASNLISDNISPSLNSETSEERREAHADKPSHGTLHVVSRPSQESAKEDKLSQTSSKQFGSSQGLWQKNKAVSEEGSVEKCGDGQMTISTQISGEPELCQIGFSPSLLEEETERWRWQQKQTDTESETERNQDEPERMEQMCSRHGKKMKSILQECSEELNVETVQPICSPTSPKSTPPLLLHTSQPLHQHFMSANTSVSSHDSSSTNISLSYIQEVPSNQQTDLASESLEKHLTPSPTPSVLQITSSSPASLFQSSSLLKSVSKQHNALRINAEEMRDATTFAVVLTQHNLKLSLESQSFLMKSRWLQPHVCLYRLSMEECDRVTDSCSDISEDEQEFDREKYIFFDANTLYSDTYSESDSTDLDDPDYNPKGGQKPH